MISPNVSCTSTLPTAHEAKPAQAAAQPDSPRVSRPALRGAVARPQRHW